MGSILCEHCAAACCRYLAIQIDAPEGKRDYDDIRWYLMHEGISIFVEEDEDDGEEAWYIQIQTVCKNLGLNNLCQVYENRPEICADYKAGDCDYACGDHDYKLFFTHHKQLEDHYEQEFGEVLGVGEDKPRNIRRAGKRNKKSA